MTWTQVAGIVRAVLAAAGGYAVAKGLVDPTQLETLIGAVLTIGAAVWSVISKKPVA